MIRWWRPGERGLGWHEARIDPLTVGGSELDRVERRCRHGQSPLPIVGDDRTIERDMDLDALAGIVGRTGRATGQLQDATIESDGVVLGDLAPVLEDEDPIEPDVVGQRPPGGLRVEGGDREAGVVTTQVLAQEGIGASPIDHAGQPKLHDEPVLERAPQALDPALGLGRAGEDRVDVEFDQRPADLAQRRVVIGQRLAAGRVRRGEGAVAVAVDGAGQTMGLDRGAQDLEIARGILLVAEGRPWGSKPRFAISAPTIG